jgi:hypothetical protein
MSQTVGTDSRTLEEHLRRLQLAYQRGLILWLWLLPSFGRWHDTPFPCALDRNSQDMVLCRLP